MNRQPPFGFCFFKNLFQFQISLFYLIVCFVAYAEQRCPQLVLKNSLNVSDTSKEPAKQASEPSKTDVVKRKRENHPDVNIGVVILENDRPYRLAMPSGLTRNDKERIIRLIKAMPEKQA